MNRVQILREVVKKLTPMLAGRGLIVTQIGSQAFARCDKDGKPIQINIPYIADDAAEDFIRAIQGFIDHEVAHVLFTDFNVPMMAASRGRDKAKAFGHRPEDGAARLHSLHNIVEDTFIERKMCERFKGTGYNLDQLYDVFINKITLPALKAVKKDPQQTFNVLLVPLMRAWSGQPAFQKFMDDGKFWNNEYVKELIDGLPQRVIDRIPNIKDSWESLEIAEELYNIIYPSKKKPEEQPPAPPSKSPSAPSGAPSGSSTEKSEDEDGSGSNTSKPEDEDDKGSKGEKEESDDEGDAADDGDADGDLDRDDDAEPAEGDEKAEADDEGGDQPDDEAGDDGDDDGAGESGEQDGSDESDDGDGTDEDEDEAEDQAEDDEEAEASNGAGSDEDDGRDDADDADDAGQEEGSDAGEDEGAGAAGVGAGEDDGEEAQPSSGEEESTEESGKGHGSASKFHEFDPEVRQAISEAVAQVLSAESLRQARGLEYRVLTRDWDIIEPLSDRTDAHILKGVNEMEDDTRHMIGPMQKKIERMMAARSQAIRIPGFRSGRLHGGSLHRLTTNDDRVFRRIQISRTKETAVSLLIDNSGSMSGAKVKTAMQAGFALSQTLERVGIKHEVLGFTTRSPNKEQQEMAVEEQGRLGPRSKLHRIEPLHLPIYKGFDERLNPVIKRRFVQGYTGHVHLDGNVDGESVRYAGERLERRVEVRKVMIVLSDGNPAGYTSYGVHLNADLHRAVEELGKKHIEVVGLGIMSEAVKTFYPNHSVLNDLKDLPGAVMGELQRILSRD